MKMSRHLKEKEERLLNRYFLLDESLQWWESEVSNNLNHIDFLENKEEYLPKDAEDLKVAMSRLKLLLGRCKMELKNMDNLENEIDDFLNQKKIIKYAPHR
ncbi:hypothetical protein CMI37_33775 [Candidatus Pacearchaeota archaeon]|nr:hypothetical protein [Candidatus Pacearchaeota archaeon]|tara:strand:+ start:257 stop:559 length:303 start_codon:yes stop_codon:yes gene_type:complete